MVAIVDTDVSINAAGDIRWEGAATANRHTVLELIQWLQDKQDDEQAAGDDLLDITVDTPFDRSTDQIVTLNSPFNIDDTFALHLYDGSVSQTEPTLLGETLYSGLNIIGPVEAGTEYMILQNGKIIPAFWGTGINPEASPSLVFSRHLIKSKFAGAEIDGRRILVLARELGDQFRRFPVTLGTGNSVAAIGNGADIFNTTVDATLESYTNITNTEGFQQIDIDGNGIADGDNEYYSQWDRDTRTINDTYERTKWISQKSHTIFTTGGTPTGADFVIDNATIVGQGAEFPANVATELLTEIRCNIKVLAGAPTGDLHAELWLSDGVASQLAEPTGAVLARSEPVLASSITGTYEEVIFRFNLRNPINGSDQRAALQLTDDTADYFAVFRHPNGAAGDNFSIQGASTDQDTATNQADDTAAVWTANAADDLGITVKSSPVIHGLPGEQMQGINIEVGYDGEAGASIAEDDIVFWGTKVDYDALAGGPFFVGEEVTFREDGTLAFKVGGIVLWDQLTDQLVVALDNPSVAVIDDNDVIEGLVSGATAAINVAGGAIEDEDLGGGTAIVLGMDNNTGTGELYLQVITGVNPVNNNRIRKDDTTGDPNLDFVDATAVLNTRTVNPEFVGTSTGSNIIGAYGIGFNKDDVGSSDRFTDLSNSPRTPPNNVQFSVSALVAGEDRVLVGPRLTTALDRGQWLVSTALTLNNETVVVVKTGTDTVNWPANKINWPATGQAADVSRLRIERDDGIYKRVPYGSHNSLNTFTFALPSNTDINCEVSATNTFQRQSGDFLAEGFENGCRFTTTGFTNGANNSTFTALTVSATEITVDGTPLVVETGGGGDEDFVAIGWDFSVASAGMDAAAVNNDVFMAFIDVLAGSGTESFTGVHDTVDRDLFVRVRDGGGTPIKTFQSVTAQFLATPQTIAAVRTSDA